MLSVVAYGRNDPSGYNAHRRIALSLNCIAEVLEDPDDEIVFVDYNTPDGLPTVPEALADTLTARCAARLRVLRVRAGIHEARFAEMTPLPIVEPVARNVAVRLANPSNRWLLMTNTDMIFLPRTAPSLTELCATLSDGFYVAPRFELPEWVWEQLPRNDPARAMRELEVVGPALRLNEVTTSHDWLRFDSAGDFQLVLRDDIVAIDGFDEEMVLGWHVDANLGKRMLLLRGSIESLENRVAGYHCNHLRTVSGYRRRTVANDLDRFVVSCERVDVPAQRRSWGLADSQIEEIALTDHATRSFAAAVASAIGSGTGPPRATDARDEKWALDYDSGHVMPHIVDALWVGRRPSDVAYLGANPVLQRMLRDLLDTLDGWPPLTNDLDLADVVIVDLGVDSQLTGTPAAIEDSSHAHELRDALLDVFDRLGAFVAQERAAQQASHHPRQVVLVNSAAIYWNAYCQAHLRCRPTTPHSRVRRATVRLIANDTAPAVAAAARARQLRQWIMRRRPGERVLELEPGVEIAVASLHDYSGFGAGWNFPDRAGITTDGSRAELTVSLATLDEAELVLTFDHDRAWLEHAAPKASAVTPAGRTSLTHELSDGAGLVRWILELPPAASVDGAARVELELGDDLRQLHLVAIALRGLKRSLVRQTLRAVHSRSGRTIPRH